MTVSPGSLDSLSNESVSVADFTSVSVQSVTGVGPTPMLPATPTPTPPLTQTPPWLSALGAPSNFSVSDQSTTGAYAGGSWQSQGTAYSGPVAGLTSELIAITPDNLNINAATPNVFISLDGGSGEDAISVSQVNGNNVLNGSTGSSFLYGGTGNDTFFVDDRNAPAGSSIWSTVAGFHSGDSATVWGVTPSDFNLSWVDGQGAAGYTGLTLHATAPGKPTASLTLAGLTSAALSNGALSISFGVTPNLPNLPGSNYMLIHYN
jgi:Ca2+-binding RTX toxin-like protein